MSHPPGNPDPTGPREPGGEQPGDPWATPTQPYGQPPSVPPYGQPAYGPPGQPGPYGYYPPTGPYGPPTNGKATAALWTGIGAVVLTFCCGAGILGVIPLVLGAKARSEIRRGGNQQQGAGMALAGIVMGVVAIVLSIAVIAFLVIAVMNSDTSFRGYDTTRAWTAFSSHPPR